MSPVRAQVRHGGRIRVWGVGVVYMATWRIQHNVTPSQDICTRPKREKTSLQIGSEADPART